MQVADHLRTRALQLIELVGHLRVFSELGEGKGEYKRALDPVFWESGGLHEAAMLTRKLTSLVGRLGFRV